MAGTLVSEPLEPWCVGLGVTATAYANYHVTNPSYILYIIINDKSQRKKAMKEIGWIDEMKARR